MKRLSWRLASCLTSTSSSLRWSSTTPSPCTRRSLPSSSPTTRTTSLKVKGLEEMNQYQHDQKYQETVTLLSETPDNSSIMTPSKDCSKTPNTTASSIRGAWCGWRQLSTLSWSRGPPLPLRRRRGTSRR